MLTTFIFCLATTSTQIVLPLLQAKLAVLVPFLPMFPSTGTRVCTLLPTLLYPQAFLYKPLRDRIPSNSIVSPRKT